MKNLQKKYEKVCNDYVKIFCEKQEMQFEGWTGGTVGGIAECNDFYFNFHDIVWDVNSNQPAGIIIDWYYDNMEDCYNTINYYSYTQGLRIDDLKKILDTNI